MTAHAPRAPLVVIVAASGERVEQATQLATTRAGGAERILLIGPGVTLESAPGGLRGPARLERRELGSYRAQSTMAGTQEARESFYSWLDRAFAGAFGRFRPRDVLASCAQLRFFDVERLDQLVLLSSIFSCYAEDEIVVVAPDAWERSVVTALRSAEAPPAGLGRRAHRLASRVRFVGIAVAALGATGAVMLRDEIRGRVSRRDSFATLSHRRLWIALAPDFARHNRHIVEAATNEVDADDLGVLVFPPLEPGEIVEPEAVRRPSPSNWSGLVELGSRLQGNAFALSVWGTSPVTLASGMWTSALASAHVVWRIARSDADVPLGRMSLPFPEVASSLARLCTVDVARARRTFDAAAALVVRTDVAGSTVLFCHSNTADAAPLHLVLREAGAVTVDYFHGWTMEATPIASESPAKLRLVWSNTEAASVSPDQEVGVLVRRHGARPEVRAERVPRRLLLLTNYAHRDLPLRDRPYRSLLQREMLAAARELTRRNPPLELRWRSHPADLRHLIEPDSRSFDLPFSPTTLAEDLAWADIAVSSISTTNLTTLRAGLPTFVHVPPESRDAMSWVAPERSFFHGAELVKQVERYLALAATSPEVAGQPEQRMWDAHFEGPLVTTLGEVLDANERARRATPGR